MATYDHTTYSDITADNLSFSIRKLLVVNCDIVQILLYSFWAHTEHRFDHILTSH